MTDSKGPEDIVGQVIEGFEPLGDSARARLRMVGERALSASPGGDSDRAVVHAYIALELGEMKRLEPLATIIASRADEDSPTPDLDFPRGPMKPGPNAYPIRRAVQRELIEGWGLTEID